MIGYSTITQKGQITLPAQIRKELGLKPNQKVVIAKDKKEIRVKAVPDIFSLYGSVKPKKRPEDFKGMRKDFIRYLSNRKAK